MVTDPNAALASEAAKAALAALSKGLSSPSSSGPAVPMVTRTDYASFYKDAGLADEDPVLLRKGTQVAAKAEGKVMASVIPPGTEVFSGAGGSYHEHPSFDSNNVYYTKPGNLTTPPKETTPTLMPATMPGSTFGWSTPTLALVGLGLGAIGFGLYMARKRRRG